MRLARWSERRCAILRTPSPRSLPIEEGTYKVARKYESKDCAASSDPVTATNVENAQYADAREIAEEMLSEAQASWRTFFSLVRRYADRARSAEREVGADVRRGSPRASRRRTGTSKLNECRDSASVGTMDNDTKERRVEQSESDTGSGYRHPRLKRRAGQARNKSGEPVGTMPDESGGSVSADRRRIRGRRC